MFDICAFVVLAVHAPVTAARHGFQGCSHLVEGRSGLVVPEVLGTGLRVGGVVDLAL